MLATACPKPNRTLPAAKRRPRKFGPKHEARTLATRLCSVLTLARAWGRCEFCWAKATEAAHGLGKKPFPAIRYDARNIFAACHSCHEKCDTARAWWDAQRRRILGDVDFDAVYAERLGKGPQLEDVIAAATVGRFLTERGAL